MNEISASDRQLSPAHSFAGVFVNTVLLSVSLSFSVRGAPTFLPCFYSQFSHVAIQFITVTVLIIKLIARLAVVTYLHVVPLS